MAILFETFFKDDDHTLEKENITCQFDFATYKVGGQRD